MDKYTFGLGAIGALAAMEIAAMCTGTDGVLLSAFTAIIGTIVGAVLGVQIKLDEVKKGCE